MQARTVAELDDLFQDGWAARDVAAIAALFEDSAVLVAPDGGERRGGPSIASLAESFWGDELAYVSEVTRVVNAGDVALVAFRWTMSTPDGEVADQGNGTDVVRRQADGTWKYLIGFAGATP